MTPLLLGFDVEPDGLDIPRRERLRWTGFERTLEIVSPMRERLAEITGRPVNFTWYLRMDPQIADVYGDRAWVAATYGAELATLTDNGDELGLHPHALRWDDRSDGWLTDTAADDWVEECMRTSFEAYASAFGRACRSHRFGDRFLSDRIVEVLRSLSVAADLTLEPGRGPETSPTLTAPVPDQRSIPRSPYHPDAADFRQVSGGAPAGDLWMLPLASADPDPALALWRRVGRRLRHRGEPLIRPVLLWAPWPSNLLWDLLARDIAAGSLTVLPFMVRADTLLRPEWASQFEKHMAALADHPLAAQVSFSTPAAVVAQLNPRA